jgi:hypothetical protein
MRVAMIVASLVGMSWLAFRWHGPEGIVFVVLAWMQTCALVGLALVKVAMDFEHEKEEHDAASR